MEHREFKLTPEDFETFVDLFIEPFDLSLLKDFVFVMQAASKLSPMASALLFQKVFQKMQQQTTTSSKKTKKEITKPKLKLEIVRVETEEGIEKLAIQGRQINALMANNAPKELQTVGGMLDFIQRCFNQSKDWKVAIRKELKNFGPGSADILEQALLQAGYAEILNQKKS